MSDVTLVAKTRVKFGGAGRMDRALGFVRTENAEEYEPGTEFTCDSDTAEDLIAAGAAVSPKDYEAEQRAGKTSEERLEEMRAELGEHDLRDKARKGDSTAIAGVAHLDQQAKEDAEIAELQKKGSGKGESKTGGKKTTKKTAKAKKTTAAKDEAADKDTETKGSE